MPREQGQGQEQVRVLQVGLEYHLHPVRETVATSEEKGGEFMAKAECKDNKHIVAINA